MREIILILVSAFSLFACNLQRDKESTILGSIDSSFIAKTSERFFPETKETEIFDTILTEKQLQITIKRTNLDTYVVNEYKENGSTIFDKYRDSQVSLTIRENSKIILDTIFQKEQFSNYAEEGFMDIAIFHNYWLNQVTEDRIELFGVISKPETDWTLAFNHYFDLKSKTLKILIHEDEEE